MSKLELLAALPYRIEVSPEDCTDGSVCYFARVVELDGCESHGATPAEALLNLEEAKRLYIQSMLEDGIEPPTPQAVAHGLSYGSATVWTVIHDTTGVEIPGSFSISADFSPALQAEGRR